MQKIALGISVQPRKSHLFQECIFFEPGPKHGKIVNLCQFAHMETALPLRKGGVFKVVDDLAFTAAGRASKRRMSKVGFSDMETSRRVDPFILDGRPGDVKWRSLMG